MSRRRPISLAVCAVPLAVLCAGCPAGLSRYVVEFPGAKSFYHLHVPDSIQPGQPAPLVVALHRFTETGPKMARLTGFNAVADRECFFVAYPTAPLRAWNAFRFSQRDDPAFIQAVVQDVSARHDVDPSRIYLVGASSGGYMTSAFVLGNPGLFAAAAVVMATVPRNAAEQAAPGSTPVLMMLGTEDPLVPYDSPTLNAGPGRSADVLPAEEAAAFWTARNGCAGAPAVEAVPDRDPDDGTATTVETYGGEDCEVVLYRIEGGGHTWPGSPKRLPGFIVGRQSKDFEASEAIWDFLSKHTLQPLAQCGVSGPVSFPSAQ